MQYFYFDFLNIFTVYASSDLHFHEKSCNIYFYLVSDQMTKPVINISCFSNFIVQ